MGSSKAFEVVPSFFSRLSKVESALLRACPPVNDDCWSPSISLAKVSLIDFDFLILCFDFDIAGNNASNVPKFSLYTDLVMILMMRNENLVVLIRLIISSRNQDLF